MQEDSNLSYIITTRNKLPYLKKAVERLLEQVETDEEVLIADGASTDGTVEYLEGLKKTGKIDYFISEPDYGESHALNKLLLTARGALIKIITDDDVYHFPSIKECKRFMLSHPQVDLLGSEGGSLNNPSRITEDDPRKIVKALRYEADYKKWMANRAPFSFCGLGMLLRRDSLPILGLFDSSFRRADAEYSLRVTAGTGYIAWYTGYSFVNVSNPQSTSLVHMKKIKDETDRLYKFYLNENKEPFVLERLRVLRSILRSGALFSKGKSVDYDDVWPDLIIAAQAWLEKMNHDTAPTFLLNENYGAR